MFRTVAKEELRVPARVEHLGELRDFVTRIGKKYGFSERIINAFKLSIDEAATNIIKHAYRDWEGDITLRAVAKKNALTMVLIDQGKYFDPRQVNSPDLQRYVEIGKKGGLGIFIMRRLLDDIEYRKSEEGNELWMVKNRDEEKKKKISISSIPLTLKMRYWLYSLTIFTMILLTILFFNFVNRKHQILNRYISSGRVACESLEDYLTHYWDSAAVNSDVFMAFKESGSKEAPIIDGALDGIKALHDSKEHQALLKEVLITNSQDILIASSDSIINERVFLENTDVIIPDDAKALEEYDDSNVYILTDKTGGKVINIVWPILDDDATRLAFIHFKIDFTLVERDINKYLRALVGELLLIWAIVSAGLFLLIYVVMNPFKRLQVWVKNLNEPGGSEQMDIDTSTEIGAIAQAFSDVTTQLRRSQVDLAEQERLQQEMHIAKQIQQTLLPASFPEIEGYDIASFYAAAKDVGGDFYDFVEVDKDTLGVAVADVSGKGVPGAFVMTMIRTALRSEARGIKDAAEVLARVNEFVVNDMKKGMFVTLFYVIIDSKRRRLNFASAGHNPMILHRPSKNKTYYLNPHGFPIGISLPDKDLFRKSIQSDTIALAEDDILMVYTDGVTEAMNPKRRLFGEERFLRHIRESGKLTANDFIESLKKEMNTFTEGSEQNDDITLVAIKEKMSAERVEYDRSVRAFRLVQEGVSIKDACRDSGISTYSYYQKYKEKFDKEGVGTYTASAEIDQVEAKHLSIEEKNKIYDVIRRFPEYGAKRITEELNTERYEFTEIPVSRIYEELVRSRLNTKELREAFVQRGGKKKRIKPPGTPMMTIDGKIILNRTQYDESVEEEEVEPIVESKVEKEKPLEPEETTTLTELAEDEPKPESIERSMPNVFTMDKTTLLTAPLEDIFEKRDSVKDVIGAENETDASADEQGKEMVEDVEAFDAVFGFVEDAAFSEDSDDDEELVKEEPEELLKSEKLTIVSKEKLQEYDDQNFDSSDEIRQIEESLLREDNDLEVLSGYEPELEDFGLDFVFSENENEDDGYLNERETKPKFPNENKTTDEKEIFDLNKDLDDYKKESLFSRDDANSVDDNDVADGDDSLSERVEEFKELLPDDDKLFSFWKTESSEELKNNSNNGKNGSQNSDVFSPEHEFADPFEEFLEIEDEFGLIGDDGDVRREISERLAQSDAALIGQTDNESDEGEDYIGLIGSEDDFREEQTQHETEVNISLDQLVSVSNDEEQFFTQHDEEFDKLIKDAMSDDGKIKRFFIKSTEDEKENKQNEIIEAELKDALRLYSESFFEAAIEKLNKLAERFPQDCRAHSLLGNAYFREKKFGKAAGEYERVIDLDPLNEKACENLAIAYAKQGELEKAIHHWERLLHITPHRMDVRLSIQRAKTFLENY